MILCFVFVLVFSFVFYLIILMLECVFSVIGFLFIMLGSEIIVGLWIGLMGWILFLVM